MKNPQIRQDQVFGGQNHKKIYEYEIFRNFLKNQYPEKEIQ